MRGNTYQQLERQSTPVCERFANGLERFSRSAMAVAASSRACHAERQCTWPSSLFASGMEAMMQTDATSTHDLIASDRVEGTPVRGTDGATIGTIERVLIDKLTGNVAYAVLSFNGFIGVGQRRLPIPWRQLTYDSQTRGLSPRPHRKRTQRDGPWQEHRLGRPQP